MSGTDPRDVPGGGDTTPPPGTAPAAAAPAVAAADQGARVRRPGQARADRGRSGGGRRSAVGVAALALLAVVALAAGLALASSGDDAEAAVPGLGPQGRRAQFRVICEYSHSATDDPIVYPGAHGASHLHDFFGATGVDADSTVEALVDGDTTCQNRHDTAAYWAPSLFDGREQVQPIGLWAYYRPAAGADPAELEPYPFGLVAIAGDATATEPQDLAVAAWHCGSSPELSADPPDSCTPNAPLTVRVAFPSCWDGERLDSEDHKAHMAYARGGRCPGTHPVAVPELVVEIRYPIWGDEHDLVLASGSPWSAHADFMNAWVPEALEREVRMCLNKGRICGVVSNRAIG